jgi:hypothetical protein
MARLARLDAGASRIALGARAFLRITLRRRYGVAAVAIGLLAPSCGPVFHSSQRIVTVSADAFAAAPLGPDRVAVLTQSGGASKVFIVGLSAGNVVKSFSVTKDATGIVAQSPDGPLVISVGIDGTGERARGAIESWTLSGEKKQVVALPARPIALTQNIDGIEYVLLAKGHTRVAAPIEGKQIGASKTIPLEDDARSLQQCKIGDRYYLVYTSGTPGVVVMRDIESGATVRSSVVADTPACISSRMRIYAISRGFMGHVIKVLQMPDLRELKATPTSAVAVYESHDQLLALNVARGLSTVEVFSDNSLDGFEKI